MSELLLIAIIAATLLWIAWSFNRLIRARNHVNSGWSDIDVQLQRRYDLIPQLVDSVKAYANYEQATLTMLTELRRLSEQSEHLPDKADAEDQLSATILRVLGLAEDYPDLKASSNFLALQQELTETEDKLQYARRFYNGAVREFSTLRESFPTLIVAKLFAFRPREFFAADPGAAAAVRVKLD